MTVEGVASHSRGTIVPESCNKLDPRKTTVDRPASRLALDAPPPAAADGLDPVRSPIFEDWHALGR
jgi:hypothetical protein